MQTAIKQGSLLTPVTGLSTWFMVEFDDGTAELFTSWDDAVTAGNFLSEADQQ